MVPRINSLRPLDGGSFLQLTADVTISGMSIPVVIMPDTYTIEALSNAIIAYYEEEKSNE